ncbi:MAG: type II toxin-antitoxin system PemK/MazF family toxin [Verrucomicrobia bacterium]|nr:type II toxin-antitoxin system PemK/MazF family toxin [Verrucomicrobiota bacterium]
MPAVNKGEIWLVDFGMVAKVRPALLLTGEPADDELDLVTVLLHTTALRGNRWELSIPKPFLRPGAFHLQQIQSVSVAKLERRLGGLTEAEMECVREALARRLDAFMSPRR